MRANCSTCYELLTCSEELLCLPCGHVFHQQCTLMWFKSKKNCPQCRQPANEKTARKIFFSEAEELDTQKQPDDLQRQIDSLQLQVRISKCDLEHLRKENKTMQETTQKLKDELKISDKAKRDAEAKTKDYKHQIRIWLEEREQYCKMQIEFQTVKEKLAKYSLVEKSLEGSIGDVNAILHERGCYSNDARDLATLVVELKKKLGETRKTKALLERQISEATGKRDEERKKIKTLSVQVSDLKTLSDHKEDEVKFLKSTNEELEEENESLKVKLEKQERMIKSLRDKEKDLAASKENLGSNVFDLSSESDGSRENESQELTFMESPQVSYRSCAIAVGEKRKALSQLSSQSSRISKKEPDMPNKKLKYGNLMEIGTLSFTDGKGYNGFGGRSNPDIFPEPLAIKRPLVMKKSSSSSNKKTGLQAKVVKNQMTVDKFFGSFDTP